MLRYLHTSKSRVHTRELSCTSTTKIRTSGLFHTLVCYVPANCPNIVPRWSGSVGNESNFLHDQIWTKKKKISSQCTTKNLLMVRKYCFISLWIFIITFAPNQFMAANLSFPILFSLCSRFYVCFSAYSENLNFIQRRYCVEQNEEMKIVIWSRRKREEDEKSATKWEMRTRQMSHKTRFLLHKSKIA